MGEFEWFICSPLFNHVRTQKKFEMTAHIKHSGTNHKIDSDYLHWSEAFAYFRDAPTFGKWRWGNSGRGEMGSGR